MRLIMVSFKRFLFFSSIVLSFAACQKSGGHAGDPTSRPALNLDRSAFRQTVDGKQTDLYILQNDHGMQVAITNYGGHIVGIWVPDRNGHFADVVLGYDSLSGYLHGPDNYFGALVGRYANRIAKGKFTLDGKSYSLPINSGGNTLHGGTKGFDSMVWDARQLNGRNLLLTLDSKDMDQGFPGNLHVQVLYTLTENNSLRIEYTAITDKPTVINLTNHAYFNLKGAGNGKITDHILMINADRFTPVDSTMIPTGQIAPVKDTPFDFTRPTRIGARINADNIQIKYAHGYDDNFVLNKKMRGQLSLAARVYEPTTGRVLEVYTTEPGVQFYTSNYLNAIGKDGNHYQIRSAFALETEHYPDSPNHANFPSTELKPGQIFYSVTIDRFSTREKN